MAAVGHDEEVFWGLHARGLAAGEDDGDESHCLVLSMMGGEDGFIFILEREESWNGISHQALGGSGRQTWTPRILCNSADCTWLGLERSNSTHGRQGVDGFNNIKTDKLPGNWIRLR